MGDVRDAERDQPLPKPGKLPVQQIMIHAIEERRSYGIRKYGRALETDNGRNALTDAWEEALDLFTYLTQARLERGDVIPGMERLHGLPEPEPHPATGVTEGALILLPCPRCSHHPHLAGQCLNDAPSGLTNCQCGTEDVARALAAGPKICLSCRHDPHEPGRCGSQALGLPCSCDGR